MRTKIYKPALIRLDWRDEGIQAVKARRVFLETAPNRVFFAHRDTYGNFIISEAYSGAVVARTFYKEKLEAVIEQANNRILNQIPEKYKNFDDFVEDYVLRHGYLPFRTNLKTFA